MAKRSGAPCQCPSKHYGKCQGDHKARFESRFARADDGCWLWTGRLNNMGYGVFGIGRRIFLAHRVAHELFKGPIPAGLSVDHVCHNSAAGCPGGLECSHRRCVNPDHLEAVSHRTNMLRAPLTATGINHRKTHCAKAGHPLSGSNLYLSPRGERQCRACRKASKAAFDERRRQSASAGQSGEGTRT